jgi:hypothetical protein
MPDSKLCLLGATLGVAGLIALGSPGVASASTESCGDYTVDPSELQIDGRLGDADSFVGILRVTTAAADLKPELQPSGPLIGADTGATIAESRVKVENSADALKPNVPRRVTVTVGGARFADTYTGEIVLAGVAGCSVKLTVKAVGPAKLTLASTVTPNLVRCAQFTCGPGQKLDFLVSERSLRNSLAPLVKNDAQSAADVTNIKVALADDSGEATIPVDAIAPTETTATLPPQADTPLPPIAIDRDQLSPGHYSGSIYLTVTGEEQRVALPVTLNVKDGPFWAIVAVSLALLVQFCTILVLRNRPRGPALKDLRALRRRTNSLGNDAGLFDQRLDGVRDLIVAGDLDGAGSASKLIDADITRVKEARKLEETANAKVSPLPPEISTLLSEFRAAVREGGTEANSKLTDLRVAVGKLPDERPPKGLDAVFKSVRRGEEAAEVPRAASRLRVNNDAGAALVAALIWVLSWPVKLWHGLVRLVRAVWRFLKYGFLWVTIVPMPWLVGLGITVGLVVGALAQYYASATFGSERVIDYLRLFATVLAATVTTIVVDKFFMKEDK